MEEFKHFGTQKAGVEYIKRRGVYGIAIEADMILIERGKFGYFLPGGGVEEGESLEESLLREIREETGYEILSQQKVGQATEYVEIVGDNEYAKKVNYFYLIHLGEKGIPTYPDGHTYPVEWMPISTADELFLESQRWGVAQALKCL